MTWVKVCGLSRTAEVAAAAEAGADAVGFVSVPGSPRFLEIDAVRPLTDAVPDGVRKVLLTKDLDPDSLLRAVATTGTDAVQPYGRHATEAAAAAARTGLLVLLPRRVGEAVSPGMSGAVYPLYDADVPGKLGGTGVEFDWESLDGLEGDFVVAGGLGPDNVGLLVERITPWGVDASSRLESDPGVKDLGKVAAFVREAKRT